MAQQEVLEESLLFIKLGNNFELGSEDGQSIEALSYLQFLLKFTEVKKIEFTSDEPFDHVFFEKEKAADLDITCLVWVKSEIATEKVIPDRMILGAIDLYSSAGTKCCLVNHQKALERFLSDYLIVELGEGVEQYFREVEQSFIFIEEDWNKEEIRARVEEYLSGETNSSFEKWNQSENPDRLGFYSWLFSHLKAASLTSDLLTDWDLEKTEMKFSSKGRWFAPEQK